MDQAFQRITDERIRAWYQEHFRMPGSFDSLVERFEASGYILDENSGLFLRKHYSDTEVAKRLGRTSMDIMLLRPTDAHYHLDVEEAIKVLSGRGVLQTSILKQWNRIKERIPLGTGVEYFIDREIPHCFVPNENTFLELRIECTGVLDPTKEICLVPFDRVER